MFSIVCNHGEMASVFLSFSIYCIFNCDTYYWFLYVAKVKATTIFWSFLIIFTKYPTKSGLKIQKCLDRKRLENVAKKIFYRISPSFQFSNQSCEVIQNFTYFTNYRGCCSQVFYKVVMLNISENS